VDAKFGEFGTADITQVLAAIRDDISDIAAITQTPSHYLMGKVANVSGETLALAETGLVKKIKQRMKSMGWAYEVLMRLAFAYSDDLTKANAPYGTVIWIDPEQNALTDQAAAAAQFISSGIPVNITMERVGGFSEEQIAEAQVQADLQAQQDMEMQQQQMQMAAQQQDHQQGMDKTGQQLDAKKQQQDHQVATIQAQASLKKASAGNPRTASNGGGNPRPKKSSLKKKKTP
jgi:hypothetical protein